MGDTETGMWSYREFFNEVRTGHGGEVPTLAETCWLWLKPKNPGRCSSYYLILKYSAWSISDAHGHPDCCCPATDACICGEYLGNYWQIGIKRAISSEFTSEIGHHGRCRFKSISQLTVLRPTGNRFCLGLICFAGYGTTLHGNLNWSNFSYAVPFGPSISFNRQYDECFAKNCITEVI